MVNNIFKLITSLLLLSSCGCNSIPVYDYRLIGYWEEFSAILNKHNIAFNSNLESLEIGDCDLSRNCGGMTVFPDLPWKSPKIVLDIDYYLRYKDTKVIKVILFHEFIHAGFNYLTHNNEDFNLMNAVLPMVLFLDTGFDVDRWLELEVLSFALNYKKE